MKLMANLVYSDTVEISSPTGSINHRAFSLNGLYDPDTNFGGHQPMYYDQYMAIYNHYCVVGSKITVSFIPNETNTSPMNVVLWQNDDSVVIPTNYYAFSEQPKAQSVIVNSVGNQSPVLQLKWSAKKTFGAKPLSAKELHGSLNANPTEGSEATITVFSSNKVANTMLYAKIFIEYSVVFFELKDLQSS